MKSIPVDDRRMRLTVATPPRTQSKANPFTGEVEWNVDLFVVADDRPDVVQVAVPESGVTKGLVPADQVQVDGLTAIVWVKDGKHGVMFRCDAIRPEGPKLAATAGAAGSSSKQAV
jgi:hypothetical protein